VIGSNPGAAEMQTTVHFLLNLDKGYCDSGTTMPLRRQLSFELHDANGHYLYLYPRGDETLLDLEFPAYVLQGPWIWEWDGYYFDIGKEEQPRLPATPGLYTARWCATPGELSAERCEFQGGLECTSVSFEYPAPEVILASLPAGHEQNFPTFSCGTHLCLSGYQYCDMNTARAGCFALDTGP
jgi:hypothetical protein